MSARPGLSRPRTRIGLAALAISMSILSCVAPSVASAQEERVAPRESIELFQRARDHYQNGRYDEAAHDLENALVLDPGSPTLLYNLARVYELSGEHERAIATYEGYLQVIPAGDDAERQRTELTIRRLQGAQEYTRPDEEAYSQTLYVQQRGVADEIFWITLIAGGVATLAAAGLGIAAAVNDASVNAFELGRDGDAFQRFDMAERTTTLALATDVTGAIGGGALVVAVLLWVLRERTVEMYPTARAAARLSPGLGSLGVGIRW